jgi:quercetin dioxygenase-like cupin family protein
MGELRIMRVWMAAGARWPEHMTPARITVQVLSGAIVMYAQGAAYALRPGQLLGMKARIPHAVEASEESEFLLTVAHTRTADTEHAAR